MDGSRNTRSGTLEEAGAPVMDRFRAIAAVCKRAMGADTPEQALDEIVQGLVDGMGFASASVAIDAADAGQEPSERWRGRDRAMDRPPPEIRRSIEELRARRGARTLVVAGGGELPGVQAGLCAALTAGGGQFGTLEVLDDREPPIDGDEARLLECLAGQLGQILERHRLLQASRQNQEYLERLVEAAGEAIIATDLDGIVQRWNPAAERMFGYTPDEAIGQNIGRLWRAEDAAEGRRLLEEVARGEGVRQRRTRRLHQDGRFLDVLLTLSPIHDAQGRVVGVSGIVRDLSAQVSLESRFVEMNRQASASEEKYRTLMENSPEAILLLDVEDLAIREANPRACELFRRSLEELQSITWPALVQTDGADTAERQLRGAVLGGRPTREIRFQGEDGSASILEIIASQVEAGDLSVIQVIGRDITERRQAETEREILKDRLLQSEKLSVMGELLSGVAHELNNPLTGVIGYAQLLRDGSSPKELRRNLERIQEEARRCHRIVQNLLTFSRHRRTERLPLSLHRVLEETLDLRAYQMRVDNIWLVKDFQPALPAVEGDAHQLQQVFMNLVTNAHQALAASGRGGVLTVSTRLGRGHVEVRVSDNGPGIPEDVRRRIFEPFFTTKGVGQGTGLGLSICQGIVKEHGGRMSVSSLPGVETTFAVEIPTAGVLQAADGSMEAEMPVRTDDQIQEAPRRVLVVDDEESIREFLGEALRARGHDVDTVANGLLALDRMRAESYDAVITDLKMPGMNGRQLYETLRSSEPELARRVIFATGDLVASDTIEFLQSTGNTYLEKPFSLRSIADALERLESLE